MVNRTKTKEVSYSSNMYIQLRKPFNILQKRVMYHVIKQLQNELYELNQQKSEGRPIERTLFGDCYFHIPCKIIDPENNDTHIRRALKGLQIPIDDPNFIGNFMLSAKREKGEWRLLFPEKAVHFLTEVSKGVTPLGVILYMSAESIYTIRLYELLMQFRDTGIWHTTPEDLCEMLGTPDSYKKNFGLLRIKALELAQKEMKKFYDSNQCEIYFVWEEERGGRGNKVQRLKFSIFWREKAINREEQKSEHMAFIYDNLMRIMVNDVNVSKHVKTANIDFINFALDKLIEFGNLARFADKLENRILQNPKVSFEKKGALARKILKEDFMID